MSFCQHCGNKLEENARFCPNCGQAVTGSTSAAPVQSAQTAKEPAPDMASESSAGAGQTVLPKDPIVQPNRSQSVTSKSSKNEKFRQEFACIAAGGNPKFSAFSLIFGPFQQLYHKSYTLFAKTYLPPMLLLVLLSGFSQYAGLALRLELLPVVIVINIIGLIWGLVISILNGMNYTRKLYEQTGGNADAIPSCPLAVGIGCVVLVVAGSLAIGAGSAAAAHEWAKQMENSFSESAQWDATSDFSQNDEPPVVPDPILPAGMETSQPVWGVVVPVETPWYGVWEDRFGFPKTYEQDLVNCYETVDLMEDGSYQITLIDSRDNSVSMVYIYLPGDNSMMNAYDGDGNYLTPYFRPEAPRESYLPEELWGVYVPISGNMYVGPEDGFIVDAYRFGDSPYSDLVQNSEDTYTFLHHLTLEQVQLTIQVSTQQGKTILSVLDDNGTVSAEFEKIQ